MAFERGDEPLIPPDPVRASTSLRSTLRCLAFARFLVPCDLVLAVDLSSLGIPPYIPVVAVVVFVAASVGVEPQRTEFVEHRRRQQPLGAQLLDQFVDDLHTAPMLVPLGSRLLSSQRQTSWLHHGVASIAACKVGTVSAVDDVRVLRSCLTVREREPFQRACRDHAWLPRPVVRAGPPRRSGTALDA